MWAAPTSSAGFADEQQHERPLALVHHPHRLAGQQARLDRDRRRGSCSRPLARPSFALPSARRTSPSVSAPTSRPGRHRPPRPRRTRPLAVIASIASAKVARSPTFGTASPTPIRSPHRHQLRAQLAAGMDGVEVARREAARFQQRHGQGVAEGQLHGGRGGGRELVGAGFLRRRQHEGRVAALIRALPARGHRDQLHAETLAVVDHVPQLRRLAGPGEGQHHVAGGDHAEVAVAGLGRMHEEGRGAGGGQRRGHLAGDVAALAHAGDHHPAPRRQDRLHRRRRRRAQRWSAAPRPGRSARRSRPVTVRTAGGQASGSSVCGRVVAKAVLLSLRARELSTPRRRFKGRGPTGQTAEAKQSVTRIVSRLRRTTLSRRRRFPTVKRRHDSLHRPRRPAGPSQAAHRRGHPARAGARRLCDGPRGARRSRSSWPTSAAPGTPSPAATAPMRWPCR